MAYVRDDDLEVAARLLRNIMDFKPKTDDQELCVTLAAQAGLDLAAAQEQLGKEGEQKKVH